MKKPNILWICTDQQRFDTLGCYENNLVKTPNIDKLANEGTLFCNAFSQSPYCTPSRASFLTGRYPRTCRGRQNGADLPSEEILVPKLFADAGYHNGLSGKLHICAAYEGTKRTREPRINDGYVDFAWSHHNDSMGKADNDYHNWLANKGLIFKQEPCPETKWVSHAMTGATSQTAYCAEQFSDFIQKRQKDSKPWLYSVNIFDPHHAFDAPREYFERYLDRIKDIPLPLFKEGELTNKPLWQSIDSEGAYGNKGAFNHDAMSDMDRRYVIASYYAMCDLIDEYVGYMVDMLEKTKLRENTIIIFTSDHGEMLGDHGIFLKGPYFYEGAIRVPLIFNWPGKIKANRQEALVELMDLPQTILDLAGLPHHPGMQGKSLAPLLTGEQVEDYHKDDIYCESYNACTGHNGDSAHPAFATMIRTERYKLVVAHNLNTGELYDLKEDPNEFNNRWNDPLHADIKNKLLLRMVNRMAFTCDPLPVRIAPW